MPGKAGIILPGHLAPYGAVAPLTTETRVGVNLGLMLATHGWDTELLTIGETSPTPGDAPPALRPSSLHSCNLLGSRRHGSYDVLISLVELDPGSLTPPTREMIWVLWDLMGSHKTLFQNRRTPGQKFALLYPECRGPLPDRDPWLDPSPKIYDLPVPIPGPYSSDGWARHSVCWTSRHGTSAASSSEMILSELSTISGLLKYSGGISLRYFGPSHKIIDGLLGAFPDLKRHGSQSRYDVLLAELDGSKISVNHFWAGSFLESALHGSVPLIWNHVKGGVTFIDIYTELDLICRVNDPARTMRVIDALMTDEGLYRRAQKAVWERAQKHTFEQAYLAFENILNAPQE